MDKHSTQKLKLCSGVSYGGVNPRIGGVNPRNGGVNPRNGGVNSRKLATFVTHGPLRLLGLSGCSIHMSTKTLVRGWSIVRACTMTLENDPEYQKLGIVGKFGDLGLR